MNNPVARRIWLTGVDGGTGLALASELLAAGHRLALTARAPAPLVELSRRFPGQVLLVTGDMSDGVQLKAMGDRIDREWGVLDTAVFYAGGLEAAALDETASRDNASQAVTPHDEVVAASLYVQEALPLLRSGRRPRLVGIASTPGHGYTAADIAGPDLRQVFQALRENLTQGPIDISVIDPVLLTVHTDKAEREASLSDIALKCLAEQLVIPGRPAEISSPARQLAAPPSRAQAVLNLFPAHDPSSKKDQ
ncbi:SDR family oxidoreductase [Pseudomonas sp. R1-18]|uniref:SDR family NAD(P)-dependent oxidoreductase n=1 Tax=Pseudomonas sp. R1-18 TaxID=1632772 RepID=UPI003DA9E6DD